MRNFYSLATALLAFVGVSNARVVDDFNDNNKTGWQDFKFNGLGDITEQNGQLVFHLPPVGQPIFAASTKTSEIYTVADNKSLEFRVDVVSGNSKDSFAILSWIPSSQDVSELAGYSIAKSPTDVLITKGVEKYFFNEGRELKNDNVTLFLKLRGEGENVRVTAGVIDKDTGASLFEYSFIDTPAADILADGTDSPAAPYRGPGHFVLMEYEDYEAGGPDVYEVIFDNAEAFVFDHTLLDDFNDNTKTEWQDFKFNNIGDIVEENGQFAFRLPGVGQAIFAASTKTSRTFEIADGEKIELSVDLVSGNSKDAFAILSWIPTSGDVSGLAGYSIAKSSTDILITKGVGKYFFNEHRELKNDNVTLVLTLTGAGQNVILNGRVLDKDANNAVLFDYTFIDTPAADILADGDDSPAAPYTGSGNFVLMEYEDYEAGNPEPYEVIFDNAWAAAPPLAANTPPTISLVSPQAFASFTAAATGIEFQFTDDKPVADANVKLTLNGQAASLAFTGAGATRTAKFAGLQANTLYTGTIEVTDSEGLTSSRQISFDTFNPASYVIESEDYNFNSGAYYNNPILILEATGPQDNAYASQIGTVDIDYADNRTAPRANPYRESDFTLQRQTLDSPRQKFVDAGGTAAGIFDYDIGEITAGDWMNYTRDIPAGTYEVYLRASLFNTSAADFQLERVTSDAIQGGQQTVVLGTFRGTLSGALYRTIPLTDGVGGSLAKVSLSGKTTLRVRQMTSEPGDGDIYQNYLVLIPTAGGELQRATVASVSPAPDAVVDSVNPTITVVLQNRDTSVIKNSIQLSVNSQVIAPAIQDTAAGHTLTYALPALPPSGSQVPVSVTFSDSVGAQTVSWTFTVNYLSLNPANAVAGTGENRGFAARFVQAYFENPQENSLLRAEEQLAANSSIPAYFNISTNLQVINLTQEELLSPDEVPSHNGYFQDSDRIPGLSPDENGTDDIAMEAVAYLDLPAGVTRFGIIGDDGFKLTSGATLRDASGTVLAFRNGGPGDVRADVVVTKAGLYPVRLVWYERSGGAHVELFTENASTGEKILVNDPNNAAAIKAYLSVKAAALEVLSSTTVNGTFAPDSTATIDTANSKITVPATGNHKFFRLRQSGTLSGGQQLRITSVRDAGANIEITYAVQ